MTQPIDHSALATFRENPERFRLAHRLHLQPIGGDDKMRAGSAIHVGLNMLRLGTTTEEAVRAARAERGELPGLRDAGHVERVLRAYAARYAAEPFSVVATEQYVEGTIHNARCVPGSGCVNEVGCFAYCGIQDAVVRFVDESEYVMDTKSTGAYLSDAWAQTMALSDQMLGYVALRRALGFRCDGYYVDGVHMTDPRPRKDGSRGEPAVDSEKDFVRFGPVRVASWQIERWAQDVAYTLAQIQALDNTRGPSVPWPIYKNWLYGKVDAYKDFYSQPVETHDAYAKLFEVRAWDPKHIAEARAPLSD